MTIRPVRTARGKRKWEVDVSLPGGLRFRRRYADKAAAESVHARLSVAATKGPAEVAAVLGEIEGPHDSMTLDELAAVYWSEYCEHENRALDSKKSRLKRIRAELGSLPVGYVTPAHIARYLTQRAAQVSPATVNRERAVIRHLFEWAIEHDYASTNPAAGVRKRKEIRARRKSRAGHERPERVTANHTELVLNALGKQRPDLLPLFQFLRWTGCRLGEALSLTHEHVESDIVGIWQAKTQTFRWFPLVSGAREAIEAMPILPGCPYVFYNPATRTRWVSVRKPWNNARKAAGLPWMEIHDLRRWRLTELYRAGIMPQDAAEGIGDTVRTAEEHYLQADQREGARRLKVVLEG